MTIIFFSGNLHKAREIGAIFADAEVRIYTDFVKKFEVVENGKSFAENAKIKLNALKNAFESQIDSYKKLRNLSGEKIILMAEDSGICVESLDNLPNIFSARFANLPPLRHCEALQNAEAIQNINADSSDKDNIMRLISELKARNLSESKASFVSCVCCEIIDSTLFSSIAEGKSNAFPLPCGGGLRGWVDSQDNNNAKFSNGDFIHPLAPSAREGKQKVISANQIKIAEFSQFLVAHGFLNGKVVCEMRGQNGFGYDPIFIPNGFDKTLAELSSEVKNALSHRKNALDLMKILLK